MAQLVISAAGAFVGSSFGPTGAKIGYTPGSTIVRREEQPAPDETERGADEHSELLGTAG